VFGTLQCGEGHEGWSPLSPPLPLSLLLLLLLLLLLPVPVVAALIVRFRSQGLHTSIRTTSIRTRFLIGGSQTSS
jgi:hypothetical protein